MSSACEFPTMLRFTRGRGRKPDPKDKIAQELLSFAKVRVDFCDLFVRSSFHSIKLYSNSLEGMNIMCCVYPFILDSRTWISTQAERCSIR